MEEAGYSLVYLFDLDAVAPTCTEFDSDRPEDQLNFQIKKIHREAVCILNYLSSLEPGTSVRFGYRFYSSRSFKPGTNRTAFRILDVHILEELEEALYSMYEQHSTSRKHGESDEYEGKTVEFSSALALGRSLQEILTDFGWKRPEIHTPKKRILTKSQLRNDRSKTTSSVIVFTSVPADENVGQFCGSRPGEALTPERVVETFVPESYFQKFRSFKISINFCDTSPCPSKWTALFSGISKILRGTVISLKNASSLSLGYGQLISVEHSASITLPKAICSRCEFLPLPGRLTLLRGTDECRATAFCLNSECVNFSSQSSSTEGETTRVTCVSVSREDRPLVSQKTGTCGYLLRTAENFFHLGVYMASKIGSSWVLIYPLDSSTATLAVLEAPVDSIVEAVSREDSAVQSSVKNRSSVEVENFVGSFLASGSVKIVDAPNEASSSSKSRELPRFDANYPCGFMHTSYSGKLTSALRKGFEGKGASKDLFTQLKEMFSKKRKTSQAVPAKRAATSNGAAHGIQNSRAFKLLNKSREVRAKIEDVNRERDSKEQVTANEKRAQRSLEKFNSLTALTESLADSDRESIVDKICHLKEKLLQEDDVTGCQMYCFTQASVSAVIKYFREDRARSFELAAEVFRDKFCLNATQVNAVYRKETNLKLREYQLQVLLRAELAWVLPSLFNAPETQETVLSFLRLLSLHGSAQLMSSFMQDTLVDSYVHALPDMLTSLYNSLNQPAPAILTETFSPAKLFAAPSPCVNVAIQSVQSVGQSSKRSTPQPNETDSLSQNTKETRSRTLLSRHPSFNEHNLRRKISLPAKASDKDTSGPSSQQQLSQPLQSQSAGPAGKPPNRVRRNLCLQLGTPSKQEADQRTPVKRLRRTSVQLPADEFTTPSKAGLFVPDTPQRADRTSERKKTDGTTIIGESPEIKTGHLRRSPRRLEACLALRRRASFYASSGADSSTGSRNWTRGESQVWTEKSAPLFAAEENRKHSLQRTSSAQFLFSKIFHGRGEDDEQLAVCSTPVKEERPGAQGSLRQDTGSGLNQTPMKTPKRVHFDFDVCQATPTPSKRTTPARGILKSPCVTRRVLDESSLKSNQELALQSPPKSSQSAEESAGAASENRDDHGGVKRALDETSLTVNKQLDLQSPSKGAVNRVSLPEVVPDQSASVENSFKRRLFGGVEGPSSAKKARHASITPLKPGSSSFSNALFQLENSPLLHTPSNSNS